MTNDDNNPGSSWSPEDAAIIVITKYPGTRA
jgi:hypothetical protein